MKKVSLLLLVFCLGLLGTGFAQTTAASSVATASTDFFVGKWEINIFGTPNGDVKWFTNLVRKDGKLTGELVDPTDKAKGVRSIKKVEESADKVAIFFESSQGGDISIDLSKADQNNLKGTLMNFDASAKRLK